MGLHLGRAQLDHGELGGDEETVEQNEEQGNNRGRDRRKCGGGELERVHGALGLAKDRYRVAADEGDYPQPQKAVRYPAAVRHWAGKWQVKVLPLPGTLVMSSRARWRSSTC